jgi:uncharacterized membrane protein YphA (DoxX/SURF4 family)
MKWIANVGSKKNIVETICLLYVLLFIYAAVSKLLDYHDFSIKLGQSPLLSAFAGYVAVGVPLLEIIIALLLCFAGWRFIGLFAAFCLMMAFTAYIFIILNFSSYVPCSCGGILQDLGWTEHLIFNLVFVILAIIGLLFIDRPTYFKIAHMKIRRLFVSLSCAGIISIASVVILFLISEDIVHNRNSFIRRFDSHAQPEYNMYDLGLNSFYFAGIHLDTIYLGNVTTPLFITKVDTGFTSRKQVKVKLDHPNLPFHDIHIKVNPPFFYVTDGTVPVIFSGKVKDWKALKQKGKVPFFTLADPIDSTTIAMRLTSLIKKQNTLAIYSLNKGKLQVQNANILEKQLDGIFDTDGMLLFNDKLNRVHYIYYYRNEFLTADRKMQLITKGKTIDTVHKAEIKVAKLSAGDQQMATPPLIINKTATVYGNLLFVKSQRIGRYEDKNMLKDASILDVYNLNDGSYISSVYIYHVNGEEIASFRVVANQIYAISGKYLSVIKLNKKITNAYNIK